VVLVLHESCFKREVIRYACIRGEVILQALQANAAVVMAKTAANEHVKTWRAELSPCFDGAAVVNTVILVTSAGTFFTVRVTPAMFAAVMAVAILRVKPVASSDTMALVTEAAVMAVLPFGMVIWPPKDQWENNNNTNNSSSKSKNNNHNNNNKNNNSNNSNDDNNKYRKGNPTKEKTASGRCIV
jgi:negative regulator of sigma E activity